MTYTTNNLILPHGGYKKLESYKTALIISDGTEYFCRKWIKDFKLSSQMNGAARSGKQCLVEGSLNSSTSNKLEITLVGNARGSFGELLEDFEDFLRQKGLVIWKKDDLQMKEIRGLAYYSDRSYLTYKTYLENSDPVIAANTLICLINQENYLLDRLLTSLAEKFTKEGGFTERMYKVRQKNR
jgi:four helix bundle suffix protein